MPQAIIKNWDPGLSTRIPSHAHGASNMDTMCVGTMVYQYDRVKAIVLINHS